VLLQTLSRPLLLVACWQRQELPLGALQLLQQYTTLLHCQWPRSSMVAGQQQPQLLLGLVRVLVGVRVGVGVGVS
jgi:hypothetical protein